MRTFKWASSGLLGHHSDSLAVAWSPRRANSVRLLAHDRCTSPLSKLLLQVVASFRSFGGLRFRV